MQDQGDNTGKAEKFVDEQTKKKIHEHLSNEHDVISEEDIKKIRTDIGSANPPAKETAKQVTNDGEKARHHKDPGIESAWNILEE